MEWVSAKNSPKFGGPSAPAGDEVVLAICSKIGRRRANRRICDFPKKSGNPESQTSEFPWQSVERRLQLCSAACFDVVVSCFCWGGSAWNEVRNSGDQAGRPGSRFRGQPACNSADLRFRGMVGKSGTLDLGISASIRICKGFRNFVVPHFSTLRPDVVKGVSTKKRARISSSRLADRGQGFGGDLPANWPISDCLADSRFPVEYREIRISDFGGA